MYVPTYLHVCDLFVAVYQFGFDRIPNICQTRLILKISTKLYAFWWHRSLPVQKIEVVLKII